MRDKNSPIWKIDSKTLKNIVKESRHFKEILEKLGLVVSGHNYRSLQERFKKENINFEHIYNKLNRYPNGIKKSFSEILVENSLYGNRRILKKRLFQEGLLKNICSICGQIPEWNGKKLVLEIDHINGIRNDNRLENLRILCPHCHSQTNTFTGKTKVDALTKKYSKEFIQSLVDKYKKQEICNILKISNETTDKILKKYNIKYKNKKPNNPEKFEVSKEQLIIDIKNMPIKYGVTDNTIRKRCIKLGIEVPKNRRGYWQKVYAGKITPGSSVDLF
jgi:protein-tyrosine-phosphatase